MKNATRKLPGKGIRILSFVPALNWLSLVCLGFSQGKGIHVFCGIAYAVITFSNTSLAMVMWLIGMVHYAVAYQFSKQNGSRSQERTNTHTRTASGTRNINLSQYSETRLAGSPERRQSIPQRPSQPTSGAYSAMRHSPSDFFGEMRKNAEKEGNSAPFVPFMAYWPTYDNMNRGQLAWYFYWRSQVRQENYMDTDLSYIFVLIYELLSGVGWSEPGDGYEKLQRLWYYYREAFPSLDRYLTEWLFDYAQQYGLVYDLSNLAGYPQLGPGVKTDLLIAQHKEDIPLKLHFILIDALSEYSLAGSKFYKEGNQALMQEAIPRVVALADAALRKETGKGILATYGPTRVKKMSYIAFQSALCPQANKPISITEKSYTSSIKLREYVNELVRYAENVLRGLRGARGRLRGVTLDAKTAKLVEAFLDKEYGSRPTSIEATPDAQSGIVLDFQSIHTLRQESDAVREALHVQEEQRPQEKALLTDVREVTAIYTALTPEARNLLDRLVKNAWEGNALPEDKANIAKINHLAEHYLGCALIVEEEARIIVEDDYRDELEYIYENPPALPDEERQITLFNASVLTPELQGFIQALVPEQKQALYALLTSKTPQQELETIAQDALTMPQILLDDINELAMNTLGDIIIDAAGQEPFVQEEYQPMLHHSIA